MLPYENIATRKVPLIGPAWSIYPVSILRVVFHLFVAVFGYLGSSSTRIRGLDAALMLIALSPMSFWS
jgi:hypothetical protein